MTPSINKYIFFLFILFAVVARLWGLGSIASPAGDEVPHIPAAENYYKSGQGFPDRWYHPPLKHLLLYGSIKVFGNNPYGWRLRNALFGILTVVMLFLLGKELFPDIRVAYLSAAFIAIDPLHTVLSMSTFEEIQATFFFVAGIYFSVKYSKGSTLSAPAAGAFLGLAMATKWYYLIAFLALLIFILYCQYKDKKLGSVKAGYTLTSFVLLPFSIYLLTFYAWFGRGYNLIEFFEMQIDAYWELQDVTLTDFASSWFLAHISHPLGWFTKSIIVGAQLKEGSLSSRFFIFMNDPPVWMLTIPAMAYLAYRGWRDKARYLVLVVILFLSTYAQFILVKRPVFLYSALACLPFAYLAVASLVVSMLSRLRGGDWYYKLVLALMFLWGVYLYPFVTSKSVLVFLYRPLIATGEIYKPF